MNNGKPMPIKGSTAIINEQNATIKKQIEAISELHRERAALVNLLARVLDDYNHHACITDKTLRAVKAAHAEAIGE